MPAARGLQAAASTSKLAAPEQASDHLAAGLMVVAFAHSVLAGAELTWSSCGNVWTAQSSSG